MTTRNHHPRRWGAAAVILMAAFIALVTACNSGSSAVPASQPLHDPTTNSAPQQAQPAPQQAQPAPVPAGTVIARYSGSGTETTLHFKVPDNGVYDVSWKYSGNASSDGFGGMTADNFIVENTGDALAVSLPNDIQASGSGSSEATDGNGTDSFNVQADSSAHWAITVKTAG